MYKKILLSIAVLGLCSCASSSSGVGEDSKLEAYNKAMFEFNYQLDKKLIKPVATGYASITNKFMRNRIKSFFNNLEEPTYMVNNLLQGEIKNTGISVGRFVVNTTLGLFGMFDVAAGWGLEKKKTTFDATMAKYCIPDGPFVVLPVVGPSTPRHLVGWTADAYMSPLYWSLSNSDSQKENLIVWGTTGLKYVNLRAENMALLDSLESSSVDFYEASKSAFMQNRKKFISLCSKNDEEDIPNYDFDFEEDYED
jgi:phospholipid-binding lipoprotein MlaA